MFRIFGIRAAVPGMKMEKLYRDGPTYIDERGI